MSGITSHVKRHGLDTSHIMGHITFEGPICKNITTVARPRIRLGPRWVVWSGRMAPLLLRVDKSVDESFTCHRGSLVDYGYYYSSLVVGYFDEIKKAQSEAKVKHNQTQKTLNLFQNRTKKLKNFYSRHGIVFFSKIKLNFIYIFWRKPSPPSSTRSGVKSLINVYTKKPSVIKI